MKSWHTSGGNNQRSGLAAVAVSYQSIQPKKIKTNGSVVASPVFDESGNACIADRAGTIQAVSPSLEVIWKKETGEGFHASPALNEEGTVLFAASVQGNVFAINTKNADVIWKESIVDKNDPRILADILYVTESDVVITSSWQEKFFALQAKDGKVKQTWNAGLTSTTSASANTNEDIFFVRSDYTWEKEPPNGIRLMMILKKNGEEESIGFQKGTLHSGKEIWSTSAPVIDEVNSRVYYITTVLEECKLHCISVSKKELLWDKTFTRQIQAAPCIKPDGTVVIGDMFGNVTGYDLEGKTIMEYKTGAAFIHAAPVCDADGVVFVGDNEGGVHRIMPNGKGKKLFEAERSIEGRPSISPQGKLFMPCMDGNVYVLG
jgi:outer membrane protein assembly factor BamB